MGYWRVWLIRGMDYRRVDCINYLAFDLGKKMRRFFAVPARVRVYPLTTSFGGDMWRVKAAPPVVRTRTRALVQCSTSTFLPSLHVYLLPPVPFPYSTRNEGPRATGYDNGYPMLVRLSFPPASSAVSFLFAVLFSFFKFFFFT